MIKEKNVDLTDIQVAEIKRMANDTRQFFGVFQNVPIGCDIRLLIEKKEIYLCEYPYPDTNGTHTYGNITWFKNGRYTITFIGLNTSGYYDEQIFALAHELYHYNTKTGKAYNQEIDIEDSITEKKADRFAAELLLPGEALKEEVMSMFDSLDAKKEQDNKILRFVAKLHCKWWLPYHSIIKRFLEEGVIDRNQYTALYGVDCRSEQGIYRRILKSIDSEMSELLNKKTKKIDISNKVIETIISNYEDGLIDDDEFIQLLSLYDKIPEDYGFNMRIEIDEDLRKITESEDNG